jgi:hypothetical protein
VKKIGPQPKSDIIRLSLLKNHGGVWADATMLCMQPLDSWVDEAVNASGMWMYHGSGAEMDRQNAPASWFIIAKKDSLIINKWKEACDEYWKDRMTFDNYFWLDALFRKLYESDLEFKHKWDLAPFLYCDSKGQAHSLAFNKRMESNSQHLKNIFQTKPPYALKLWWVRWQNKFPDIKYQGM